MSNEISMNFDLCDGETGEMFPIQIIINEYGILVQLPDDHPEGWGSHEDGIFRKEAWIEFYGGKLQVHAWDGSQEDPNVTFMVHEE